MTTTAALQLELLDVDGHMICTLHPNESRREVLRIAPADAGRAHSIRMRDPSGIVLGVAPLFADPAGELTDEGLAAQAAVRELVARLRR